MKEIVNFLSPVSISKLQLDRKIMSEIVLRTRESTFLYCGSVVLSYLFLVCIKFKCLIWSVKGILLIQLRDAGLTCLRIQVLKDITGPDHSAYSSCPHLVAGRAEAWAVDFFSFLLKPQAVFSVKDNTYLEFSQRQQCRKCSERINCKSSTFLLKLASGLMFRWTSSI